MKIASFNVENLGRALMSSLLFARAEAFDEDVAASQPILEATEELNRLFEEPQYTPQHLQRMSELIVQLGLAESDEGPYVILRQSRAGMVSRPKAGGFELKATGRSDWVGWVELKSAPVNEIAVHNTGRVIRDVNADILAAVDDEGPTVLAEFSEYLLGLVDGEP